jgi:hypothetical protein
LLKLVTDARYGEILGAHLVGPEVTELLPELTIAQMMELTPAEIARNVHAHPTLSEALMEAAHDADAINLQSFQGSRIFVGAGSPRSYEVLIKRPRGRFPCCPGPRWVQQPTVFISAGVQEEASKSTWSSR